MIDLHTHTTASDGTLSPTALVRLAAREGVRAIAVTDHDTIDGLAEAQQAAEGTDVTVLVGLELATEPSWGGELHVLAYGFDPANEELVAFLAEMRRRREGRAPRIVERLRSFGLPITLDDVRACAGSGVLGRLHIARAMVARRIVSHPDEAFARYLKRGAPAHVPREVPPTEEGIRLVRRAGGLPVIAHPGLLPLCFDDFATHLGRFVAAGLGGLECSYPAHSRDAERRYRRLAKANRLIVTGGSDFHGPGVRHHVSLGHGTDGKPIPDELLEGLLGARSS